MCLFLLKYKFYSCIYQKNLVNLHAFCSMDKYADIATYR